MSTLLAHSAAGLALRMPKRVVSKDLALEQEVLDLFDLMHLRLLRYAISFGIPMQDGEDVVQETFLALFHHLQLERSRSNLCGWLFKVTHNLALKRRAKGLRESGGRPAETAEQSDPDPNPEECLLFSERQALLRSTLQALSLQDQMCLRLRSEGLRYREIAEIIGISLGSVSTSLSRSLTRLQQVDRR